MLLILDLRLLNIFASRCINRCLVNMDRDGGSTVVTVANCRLVDPLRDAVTGNAIEPPLREEYRTGESPFNSPNSRSFLVRISLSIYSLKHKHATRWNSSRTFSPVVLDTIQYSASIWFAILAPSILKNSSVSGVIRSILVPTRNKNGFSALTLSNISRSHSCTLRNEDILERSNTISAAWAPR